MDLLTNKQLPHFFIILFCIFFISSHKLHGQDTGLGVKTSLEISSQLNNFQFTSGDLELDLNPQFSNGYSIGLIYRNRITRNIRIQAEPTYTRVAARYQESFIFRGFEFETDSESELSYLQLPLLVGFTTTPTDLEEFPKPWEGTTYHAVFGIYGGYLLDASFSGTNTGTPIGVDFEEEFSDDVTSRFNSFDAGLVAGGGFEHGYLNKMGMEVRLFLGIIDAINPDEVKIEPNNVSISVTVYYIF